MTMLKRICVAITLTMTVAATAQARSPVPIVNHDQVAWVRPDRSVLDPDAIKAKIVRAAQGKKWSIADGTAERTLIGTLVVRNKHTIRTTITYGPSAFSVHYLDSVNMKYGMESPGPEPDTVGNTPKPTDGKPYPVIHPYYNVWVQELVDAVRAELEH